MSNFSLDYKNSKGVTSRQVNTKLFSNCRRCANSFRQFVHFFFFFDKTSRESIVYRKDWTDDDVGPFHRTNDARLRLPTYVHVIYVYDTRGVNRFRFLINNRIV